MVSFFISKYYQYSYSTWEQEQRLLVLKKTCCLKLLQCDKTFIYYTYQKQHVWRVPMLGEFQYIKKGSVMWVKICNENVTLIIFLKACTFVIKITWYWSCLNNALECSINSLVFNFRLYHVFCWGVSLVLSLLPFINDHYGPAGAWW